MIRNHTHSSFPWPEKSIIGVEKSWVTVCSGSLSDKKHRIVPLVTGAAPLWPAMTSLTRTVLLNWSPAHCPDGTKKVVAFFCSWRCFLLFCRRWCSEIWRQTRPTLYQWGLTQPRVMVLAANLSLSAPPCRVSVSTQTVTQIHRQTQRNTLPHTDGPWSWQAPLE